jgi:insulysin
MSAAVRVKRDPIYRLSLGVLTVCLFWVTQFAHATPSLEKSPTDDRAYQYLTLDNQLDVLVISDPNTDQAAVSMDVGVGSMANPKDREGLAHFLEHMLFLGTQKYPKAGDYQAFITSHGGTHNAFTALDNTNYYFNINANDLEPALDRFSQFFIAPLFQEAYTDRERNAVNSEYRSKIRDDNRRVFSAMKEALNPDHPANRFAVGDLKTLSNKDGDLRQALIDFYTTQYSANRMKLVILGQQPIDQLTTLAKTYFSAVPNRDLPRFNTEEPLYPKDLPKVVSVKTITDQFGMTLTFPMPNVDQEWKTKPLDLISGLIGYEGDGSILAALKKRGWANALGASQGQGYDQESALSVFIDLTEEGYQHKDDVLALFFQYISALKTTGVPKAIFDEERHQYEQAFRFQDQPSPVGYVTRLSQQMQHATYPKALILKGPYLLEEYQPTLIDQLIKRIRPDNLLMVLQSNQIEGDKVTPHYNTPYSINPLDAALEKRLANVTRSDELFVRAPNPFVAEHLAIKDLPKGLDIKPTQLEGFPKGLSVWYAPDASFNRPKANVWFTFLTPKVPGNVEAKVAMNMYISMVEEQLNKTLYDATIAGLSANIYPHMRGFTVRISGYDEKLDTLVKAILPVLRHPEANEQRFNRLKHEKLLALSNQDKETPYHQLFGVLYDELLGDAGIKAQFDALSRFTEADLEAFIPSIYQGVEVRLLAHGNVDQAQVTQLANHLLEGSEPITLAKVAPTTQVKALNEGETQIRSLTVDHKDQAVVKYLQAPDTSLKNEAAATLLAELISAPFYSDLRTEQQLGYIVTSMAVNLKDQGGMALVVQSPTTDVATINQKMDLFLDQFEDQLKTLNTEDLDRFKNSVLSRINERERTLGDRTGRFWENLDEGHLQFDWREQRTNAIMKLTAKDLVSALNAMRDRAFVVQTTAAEG